VAGTFSSAVSFGSNALTPTGQEDAFVAKLSGTSLTPAWARHWGGVSNNAVAQGVAFDSSGQVLVGGVFQGSIDVGPVGAVIPAKSTNLDAFIASLDGVTGQTGLCARLWRSRLRWHIRTRHLHRSLGHGIGKDSVFVNGQFIKVVDLVRPPRPSHLTRHMPSGTCLKCDPRIQDVVAPM